MILADKIIENRKKLGWSQEELADRLGVSRQSVSKWESAQAVPDMKKILQLSEVFGVSTDYLLRDDLTEPSPQESSPVDNGLEDNAVRRVTMEEANEFLDHTLTAASRVSTGVMICILSPVLMILLGGLADAGVIGVEVTYAGAAGLAILLVMVAVAVGMFISIGLKGTRFQYLETDDIDTEYGVSGMAKDLKSKYAETHSKLLIFGIMLCVLAAVPVFIIELIHFTSARALEPLGISALLIMIAAGVKMIVLASITQGGYDKLLEEGDYTRLNKRAGRYDGIYWAIATAVYLGWSFITMRWELTWIVWPIAGVIFAAYHEIMKSIARSRR